MLCFGDTVLNVDTKDFSLLTTLVHCEHNQPRHVICVHAGECQGMSPIAVIPPPHIPPADVPFLSAVIHEHETNLDQGEHVVNYTSVLCLINYLGGDKRIIEKLLGHVHKLAAETLDVRIAYEISRMFKTYPDMGVVKTVDYFELYKHPHADHWTPLWDKPWKNVIDLIRQLSPLSIVTPRDDSRYEIAGSDAAVILNIPECILQLVNDNKTMVTIAGGAALAVCHHRAPSSLLLPSSDVDIFFFKAANENPTMLTKFIQCLRDNDYVVYHSSTCVITAFHTKFRTVQLIGCESRDGITLVGTFDFWNVQIYYDGARCYETVQAAHSNISMTPILNDDATLFESTTTRHRR